MDGSRLFTSSRLVRLLIAGTAFCAISGLSLVQAAAQLAPQTKLRVTVVKWNPTEGEYQRWDALGGEFAVTAEGTIVLPVIGPVAVGELDSAGLADTIATRLQDQIGLVRKPDTTVEIVEFPPVYVVGDVNAPGQYQFRSGMTVLQTLALAGGEYRDAEGEQSQEQIRLVSELQSIDNEILRSQSKIARLEAELAGAGSITFPPTPATGPLAKLAAQVHEKEKIIFKARANGLARQAKSLSELRDLLNAEIDVLNEKIKAADLGIASGEKELAGVKTLVEKGIAVASRQSDLERVLAGFRADRLDQVTAVMRARQNITEATRNLEGLRDQFQTDVAAELQREEASLDQLRFKRDMAQKLLLETLASQSATSRPGEDRAVEFTITRRKAGDAREISADESTVLLPGDVLKVSFMPPAKPEDASQ